MNMVEAYAEIMSMRNDVAMILTTSRGYMERKDADVVASRIVDQIFIRLMQNTKKETTPEKEESREDEVDG